MYLNTFLNTNFDHDYRDHVRILILEGLFVIDWLFLFSFLNPKIPGGLKPLSPLSNVVPVMTFLWSLELDI